MNRSPEDLIAWMFLLAGLLVLALALAIRQIFE
ncbi:protein MgtR [Klebsiella aerogenes]|nr:protein MgtR [Klebsiella aerogenes]MDU9125643.1 protein MgtR [Klebsiella aerogenes]